MRCFVKIISVVLILAAALTACGSPAENTVPSPTGNGLDLPEDVSTNPTQQPSATTSQPSPSASQPPEESAAPEALSQEELWNQLEGFWTYKNEFFVVFHIENGQQYFNAANWYSEFPRNSARVTGVTMLSERKYHVALYYDEYEDEMVAHQDAMVSAITVDLGAPRDNKISVQMEDGTSCEYTYAGATMDQALEWIER